MEKETKGRRAFLKGAMAGAAAAATPLAGTAQAQLRESPPPPSAAPAPTQSAPAYAYLNADEAAFVEALVDHMVPADEYTAKGTDLGLAVYIDRALAGAWGKGERLYQQGPWKTGTPNQGYQLPLTPAALYRAGIAAANAHCAKSYGKPFDKIGAAQRQEFLLALQGGKITFESGPPARVFFVTMYQTVVEGLFADPIHGGNRDKAGWKLLGFPGALAVYYQNVEKYRGKKYPAAPVSIQDMS